MSRKNRRGGRNRRPKDWQRTGETKKPWTVSDHTPDDFKFTNHGRIPPKKVMVIVEPMVRISAIVIRHGLTYELIKATVRGHGFVAATYQKVY